MRKHNGMRPQDVVVLLKITTLSTTSWQGKDLAAALFISPAEISDALRRCQYARLLAPDGRTVQQQALLRFLQHGLPYVFPAHPSGFVQGTPTAWSALPQLQAPTEPAYVWPDPEGQAWGLSVSPLYASTPAAARLNAAWHEVLALVDVLRLGASQQRKAAYELLSARLI
ncbi:hypothetical protein J0X19_13075 [Hymenobacter sp. BT186]|uniref:Uncharacterized protein n=1 Tax=Hymenobacter telluris TaxID=2816474 RepID=A0A939EZU7_9BACT|nr:hypothetical protein [Hymenobacter telluris]MBO0358883.1 hypothetical protein [Hymenobacter telluris]MBW3374909.1 hypothetical protein [Hymenobacter norwichensis]